VRLGAVHRPADGHSLAVRALPAASFPAQCSIRRRHRYALVARTSARARAFFQPLSPVFSAIADALCWFCLEFMRPASTFASQFDPVGSGGCSPVPGDRTVRHFASTKKEACLYKQAADCRALSVCIYRPITIHRHRPIVNTLRSLLPPSSVLNMMLSAFGAEHSLLSADACSPQLSIDIFCQHGDHQQTRRPPLLMSIDGTERRKDGRTPDRYVDPALHIASRTRLYGSRRSRPSTISSCAKDRAHGARNRG